MGGGIATPVPTGPIVPPVVISERPSTPGVVGVGDDEGEVSEEIYVPPGWETVVIGGETRIRVPEEFQAQNEVVLDPIDPQIFNIPVPTSEEILEEESVGEDMATDWGAILSGAVDIWQGQTVGGGGGGIGYGPPGGPIPPALPPPSGSYNINPRTGQLTKCKRRRRRALLTQGDLNVLNQVASLPNNANVRTALARAVGRSR